MFGLSLDWDRCPDGVALETAAEVQESTQLGLRSRAYREWNRNRPGEERSTPPDDWLESRLAEYRIEEHGRAVLTHTSNRGLFGWTASAMS
jgi:hypothetical protein